MGHSAMALSEEERRAIEVHKWYVSQRAQRDVGWEAAVEDWIRTHQAEWRALQRRQQLLDNAEQARAIREYAWIRSEQAGADVSPGAIEEWVALYASEWRARAAARRRPLDELLQVKLEEGRARHPPSAVCRAITVEIEKGLHVRPSMDLKRLIDHHAGCQVYVHNVAAGTGAHRITEMMDILSLGAIHGDVLIFGVIGPAAPAVLDAIDALFVELARRRY